MASKAKLSGVTAAVTGAAMLIAVPFITGKEGTKLQDYQDIGGKWTWCNGETAGAGLAQPAAPLTADDCAALTRTTVGRYMGQIAPMLTGNVSPNQLAAYTSLAYNIGVPAFSRSKALSLERTGQYEASCDAIENWFVAGGRDCRVRANNCYGIVVRRQQERDLCRAGIIGGN